MAALVCIAALAGCADSHGSDCPDGDGPYGLSRCALRGTLTPEEKEAYCVWEASTNEGVATAMCERYWVTYRDLDTCLDTEGTIPVECEQPLGETERCALLAVEDPCSESLLDCLIPDCLARPDP